MLEIEGGGASWRNPNSFSFEVFFFAVNNSGTIVFILTLVVVSVLIFLHFFNFNKKTLVTNNTILLPPMI
jgi:hypothetical protein